ncbi:MAG TPA: hypothetical protein PK431_01665 [Chitinophagales bacterium]|nr:hypothetical protein [Chitinophagales bacterium]
MKRIITYIAILFLAVSCATAKKTSSTIVIEQTNSDSLIQSALAKIKTDSVVPCKDLQVDVVRLSQALSDCYKYESQCSTVIVDKSKTKYKNSFNDITKNSNNTTEVNNLKRSVQLKSDSIANLTADNLALNGKVKDLVKIKKSTTGDSSPNTNKSGNTTKKAEWYLWLIVFIAGGITSQAIRSLITKSI